MTGFLILSFLFSKEATSFNTLGGMYNEKFKYRNTINNRN